MQTVFSVKDKTSIVLEFSSVLHVENTHGVRKTSEILPSPVSTQNQGLDSFPENKLLRVQVGVGPVRPQYSVFLKADGMAVILVLLCEGSLLE